MSDAWPRKRVRFLAISFVFFCVLLILVRQVLLPFILAIIVAYVLTPLVALVERYRVPRAAAILLVYAVTGTVLYFSAAAAAPRLYEEAVKLKQEIPALSHKLKTSWGPFAENKIQGLLGRDLTEDEPEQEEPSVLEVLPKKDGSLAIRFRGGLDIRREDSDLWRLSARSSSSSSLSVSQLLADAVDQSIEYVKRNAVELIRVGQAIVSSTARAVILTFMTLMCAGYLMHTRDEILEFFRSLPPKSARPSFDRFLRRADEGLAGVVRGQLIICLLNGVLSAIGFVVLGLKYWPILAIIAGVMSIIPIFGSILSTIPAVLIGLTQDVWIALWVLVWILIIHQFEANLFNPKIIGVSAKLHPVLVIFALIVGEHFYGLWGALLAVPALSLVYSLFNHFRYESLPDAPPDSLREEALKSMAASGELSPASADDSPPDG